MKNCSIRANSYIEFRGDSKNKANVKFNQKQNKFYDLKNLSICPEQETDLNKGKDETVFINRNS